VSQAVVRFPLRGEWIALHSPGDRIPSHGTDYFAQTYACDFAQLRNDMYYERGLAQHLLAFKPASEFFCWNQAIHSVAAGHVVRVADGWADIERVNLFLAMARAWIPRPMRGDDYRPLAGNYVIVQGDAGYALYAHLRNGSVTVRPGQEIAEGEIIGAVGNSGNSSMPHLHFQLMDAADPMNAKGLPFAFSGYERFAGGEWIPESAGVPKSLVPIRSR
jgi:hypothetical protein